MTIGMELLNPKPGVCLTVSDLVRNLVLAPLLDRPAAEMEEVLRQHWLPLELRFGSPVQFDAFLQRSSWWRVHNRHRHNSHAVKHAPQIGFELLQTPSPNRLVRSDLGHGALRRRGMEPKPAGSKQLLEGQPISERRDQGQK